MVLMPSMDSMVYNRFKVFNGFKVLKGLKIYKGLKVFNGLNLFNGLKVFYCFKVFMNMDRNMNVNINRQKERPHVQYMQISLQQEENFECKPDILGSITIKDMSQKLYPRQ